MGKDLIARYVWLVDTLLRYRRLTRTEINELWQRSHLSGGVPMPERTFFNYRRAIEENFHIEILCTRQGEYYIDEDTSGLSGWLVDSMAVNNLVKDSGLEPGRMEVEDVPSAREYLSTVLEAMKSNLRIVFDYHSFSRSRPDKAIEFCPYLLKRYKQRWYVFGMRVKGNDLRTYALDRMSDVKIDHCHFELPPTADAEEVFGSIVGVTSSKADVKTVKLRTTYSQAKYLRALPLHKSQVEMVHDSYSIFIYRLKLNYELVSEIMALGPEAEVLEPPELRAMVITRLRDTLRQYDQKTKA